MLDVYTDLSYLLQGHVEKRAIGQVLEVLIKPCHQQSKTGDVI